MKYFVVLIILIVNVFSQQYWIEEPCPTTKKLYRLSYTDSLFIWASGDSGAVINTTNGGQNWNVQQTGIESAIDDMFFINRQNGWFVANDYNSYSSLIFRTTNGGNSWLRSNNPDSSIFFHAVYFQDSLTGYIGGTEGKIFKTSNGGMNWKMCQIDSSAYILYPVRRIKFFDPQNGFAGGGQFDFGGVIWVTTNAGQSWKINGVSADPALDIKFFGLNKILFTGGGPDDGASVITTTDVGHTWHLEFINCWGVGQAFAFRTPSEVWIPLGFSGQWAVNLDSAAHAHWFCVPQQDSVAIMDAFFATPDFGLAAGFRGYLSTGILLKYNKALIGINGHSSPVPEKFVLYQNYPNPFNPNTEIKFYLPESDNIKIIIFDVLGKEINFINEEHMQAGYHNITFNGDNLSSGVYLYSVQSSKYWGIKKMVLLK